MFTINCKGKLLTFDTPVVMGIINATPDSFYEGHLTKNIDDILALSTKMISEGAGIIDVGGQSTKPYSERIDKDEELRRVIPVIEKIHLLHPKIILSVDTYYSEVAKEAVAAGASIINDISAGCLDDKMIETVAALGVPYVCMHMKGTPGSMQQNPLYKNIVKDILNFFIDKVDECKKAGIKDIIIDPGFGFGKTIEQNLILLRELGIFKMLDKPILAGLSRKSTVYKTLQVTPRDALNGTTVLNTIALMNGANILRVHDVKEAREAVTLINAYIKNAPALQEHFL
ncbi:MAG: dihydropteroate synthase [Chitinophagaceae bacterium]|nr:dihydropteroate synthase [Chitinophagaceae bacterium]